MSGKMELSLDSGTFRAFKADFQQLLNGTLNTMQQKSVQFLQDGNPKVGDMTANWKIGNRVTLSLEIDSERLSALNTIAADEGKTINEKVEDILWWAVEQLRLREWDVPMSFTAEELAECAAAAVRITSTVPVKLPPFRAAIVISCVSFNR